MPECGKEISDKSKQCIHCGFPLPTVEDVPDGFCLIDGVPRDLREALNKIDDYPTMTPDEQKRLKGGFLVNAKLSLFMLQNNF